MTSSTSTPSAGAPKLTLLATTWWRASWLESTDWQKPGELRATFRRQARTDLAFLLSVILGRSDIEHPWLWARCREVEQEPDGYLDIWAREHYKSTIITFGLTIQDILANHGDNAPGRWAAQGIEPTFGIFSHTRPTAKKFLRQIKQELEQNERLQALFPDVLWSDPAKEATKWSEDDGLAVRRKSNPKEQTVEAWGIVDSQPTGAHFTVRVYDDVVEQKAVQTIEAMKRTTDAWSLSLNLGARGGVSRYPGTRYHLLDTYGEMIKRGAVEVRRYPATVDGTVEGEPVLLTRAELDKKRGDMGNFTYACQMLQDPQADNVHGFDAADMRFYRTVRPRDMNVYLIVDPANEKKKTSDYTAMDVIGLGSDENYYMLDMVRDRLNLRERTEKLFELHRKWKPRKVGYEKYGMQADIEHIEYVQEQESYHFAVTSLAGTLGNLDRVRRLIPTHEQNRWYYPEVCQYVDYEGRSANMTHVLRDEELTPFPVGMHADMMDAQSRIFDEEMAVRWPTVERGEDKLDYAFHAGVV